MIPYNYERFVNFEKELKKIFRTPLRRAPHSSKTWQRPSVARDKLGFSERYALAVRIALTAFHLAEGEM